MASPKLAWNVALAGECMVARPFAMHDDTASLAVVDLLRGADLTYAHLEMNFADYSELTYPSRGDWLGSFMMADPRVARDLKWAGIDIMSLSLVTLFWASKKEALGSARRPYNDE